jgi:hypothetical protein
MEPKPLIQCLSTTPQVRQEMGDCYPRGSGKEPVPLGKALGKRRSYSSSSISSPVSLVSDTVVYINGFSGNVILPTSETSVATNDASVANSHEVNCVATSLEDERTPPDHGKLIYSK